MPFHIGSGCLPAIISNRRIYRIAWSDTPPEMSSWEKMKEFFCSTHQTEALGCIWTICHPPAGTTREDVVSRFELLRTLAYDGWEENIHSGLHGENYFCILDEDSQEILSVTLDDVGNYTVNCQGYSETHHLTMATEPGVERIDITYNLTSDIDAAAYLEELKQNPIINNKIMNPVGQCESLMTPVSNFMNEKGFDNIRYRGIFIWDKPTEEIPTNHFAVVGNKEGKDYVFDVSAHQFENRGMSNLNGPLILSADEWVCKYRMATRRKLIYYTDFSNSSIAANAYDALPRELESESMAGKVFVTSPRWFNTFKKQKYSLIGKM
ncbi:SPI-2 type III secretion system effector SseI [Salmonella enterica subsp. enterica serovar Weltevreden]|nr:SPI-2 type III secretion system effector SseI [Salmonella enterica subsp. enterica]EHH1214098.1 SPI-2 type III secretion system effector SseI [Salmonella enterica subsp. enterica serovar Weltevreden]